MRLAIVGFGPRGLFCLEQLIKAAINNSKLSKLELSIFEPNENWGTGLAWRINQSQANWVNISDAALKDLPSRAELVCSTFTIKAFPSYTNWCITNGLSQQDTEKDNYPERSKIGHYLHQRACSILKVLEENKKIKRVKKKVIAAKWQHDQFSITTADQTVYWANACVLTLGHQPTKHSEAVQKHAKFAEETPFTYIHDPYSTTISTSKYANKSIAIMGFGLTMIDVMRMLTTCQGGRFKTKEDGLFLSYLNSGADPKCIIPYSLDGLPSVPKPYSRKIDDCFMPSKAQKEEFERNVKRAMAIKADHFLLEDLLEAFSVIALEIYDTLNKAVPDAPTKALVLSWLKDASTTSTLFLNKTLPIRTYILETIKMAMGKAPYTLDYVIGQVWRHMQPTMYRLFAYPAISTSTMKALIDVDERTKRYSFGPPVESMLQLLALIDAGLIITTHLDSPEISKTDKGWCFKKNNTSIYADVLINSIIANPDLEDMDSPLLHTLKSQNLLQPVAKGLGVKTNRMAIADNASNAPLYVIGRNAKGSVLGVDAILECFSRDIEVWANYFIHKL